MKGNGAWLKKIAVILSVVLVLGLVAVLAIDYISDRTAARDEQRYRDEIAPLLLEKATLEQSMKDIEAEYMADAPCGANTSLVFTDLDAPLYDLIYPLVMQREHLTGIVCLSLTELPDLEGKITGEELDEMLCSGWTTAFYWDGEGDLEAHLLVARDTLESLGLPMTDTILFERLRYAEQYDELLAEYGVRFALQYGDGANALVDKGVEGDVLHPGIIGWNASGYGSSFLMSVEIQKGVAAFGITFEAGEDQGSYFDPTRDEYVYYFERMLDAINESATLGDVTCTSFAEAYKNREGYVEAYTAMENALGSETQRIIDEIAEIDREILEIRRKYE